METRLDHNYYYYYYYYIRKNDSNTVDQCGVLRTITRSIYFKVNALAISAYMNVQQSIRDPHPVNCGSLWISLELTIKFCVLYIR